MNISSFHTHELRNYERITIIDYDEIAYFSVVFALVSFGRFWENRKIVSLKYQPLATVRQKQTVTAKIGGAHFTVEFLGTNIIYIKKNALV